MDSGTDWLCEILQSVQLEQFYLPIRDQLQITRLAHFDYVRAEDLESIGISKPGVRRLFDAVRKKKLQQWNRKFWNKLFGSSTSLTREKTDLSIRRPQQTESQTTCIILEKDIILHNELGNGSFGVVKRGEWKMSSSKSIPVAVKVLKADAFSQPGIYDDFRREVEAMHSLQHTNLIKLHGVVFHPLMMVCELAPMGALLDYIRAQNGKVSLHYISKWSEQVAAGMAYLEKNRFLHRDLACRNILLSTLDLAKIGDFGLMRALPDANDCYVMSERRRVPFPWCAPESLRSRQFSHASDVWMFAVALWEMYSFGEDPWMGLNGSEILRLIMREGQRLAAPTACPPDVYMLMMQCWDLDPKARPTFAGIQRYMETNKFETAVSALSYRKQGQMSIEAGDALILIDKRPELHWWKGQNQRTLEVGLFPSTLVSTTKNKNIQGAKKSLTLSPVQKAKQASPATSPLPANGVTDDLAVVLRKRKTIESTQPASTRAGNSGNKQFNYNKLVNDNARNRAARAVQARSFNQVREDLLIDLDLPPSTKAGSPTKPSANHSVSIIDQPIDVPEFGQDADWNAPSLESLPSYSTGQRPHTTNLCGAKSLDNLSSPTSVLNSQSNNQPDPFDTSQFWPIDRNPRPNYDFNQSVDQPIERNTRPNYDFQQPIDQLVDRTSRLNYDFNQSTSQSLDRNVRPNYDFNPPIDQPATKQPESHRYASNNQSTSHDIAPVYNNSVDINRYSTNPVNSSPYGQLSHSIYSNTANTTTERQNYSETVVNSLASMSLDDRISESLNLRTKNTNEAIYANNTYNAPSTSASNTNESRYKDIPIYGNFDVNPTQQQFILETKDYYTKLSTVSNTVNTVTNYDKNIYVPKKEESEKLQNFSDSLQNSKNYSALKYQNVDHYQYGYTGNYSNDPTTSQTVQYDIVNDTDSNFYSEIGDSGANNQGVYAPTNGMYTNTSIYDEVYEAPVPIPHRPAPPCPSKPK